MMGCRQREGGYSQSSKMNLVRHTTSYTCIETGLQSRITVPSHTIPFIYWIVRLSHVQLSKFDCICMNVQQLQDDSDAAQLLDPLLLISLFSLFSLMLQHTMSRQTPRHLFSQCCSRRIRTQSQALLVKSQQSPHSQF